MAMLVGTSTGLIDAADLSTVAHAGHDVVALAGDWAVLDGLQVEARDGRPAPLVEAPPMLCLAQLPGGDLMAGTAEAHLYRLAGEGAERLLPFDEAESRDDWYTPWGGPPAVRSLAASADGTLLANVHVGGILRSTDDGTSWHPTIDLEHDVHQVLALPGGAAVAACASGLALSCDDGATWSIADQGLHATYSRAVAVCGDTVLLSASTGPMGEKAAVYRRPLTGDQPFQRCRSGLPEWFDANVDTFWMAGRPDGTAALATGTGEVYATSDEGATWELAASGVVGVRCLALT